MTFSINSSDKILVLVSSPDELAVGCGGFISKYHNQVEILCTSSENNNEESKTAFPVQTQYGALGVLIRKANIGNVYVENYAALKGNFNGICSHDISDIDMNKYDIIMLPYFEKNNETKTSHDNQLKSLLEEQGCKCSLRILRYEVWNPIKEANYYEDISDFVGNKKELILSYKKSSGASFADSLLANNKFRTFTSYLCGTATHVEAFYVDDINAYMRKPDIINAVTDKDYVNNEIESYLNENNAQQKIGELIKNCSGKKIIVYGADNFSRCLFKNYNLSGLDIIAIADKRFEQMRTHEFYGLKCIKPQDMATLGADLILIADIEYVKTYDILTNKFLKDSNIEIAPFIKTDLSRYIKSNVGHKICTRPFHVLSIVPTGHCITCCPAYINNYVIGNIFQSDFDEIWNGKRAKFLRDSLLKDDYTICDLKTCIHMELKDKSAISEYYQENSDKVKLPDTIYMGWDYDCNVACITCRNQIIKNDSNSQANMQTIEKRVLEACKDAKYFYTSGNGDPFGSAHARSVIKKVVEVNPDIKFLIHTNGILCNKKMCDELNITDKIKSVTFSIHAAHKETYDKIVRYGNFDRVLENLKWLSSMKQEGNIEDITLVFVVHKLNYKDMPDFVRMAEKYNAVASFRYYRQWANNTEYSYKDMAVFDKSHPEYEYFVATLKNDIFYSSHCTLDPSLNAIRNGGG